MPHYPSYPTQPRGGIPPTMWSEVNRASDLTYSGSTAPHFQGVWMRAHGRQLAGLGTVVQDEDAERFTAGGQPAYAWNELNLMAHQDDVQANGIFDPPDAGPNIYPDAGILATRFDLPGYLARERMFAPSEVRDVTTGRPIIPVPNSPVSFDTSQQIAFIERGMYQPPEPVIRAQMAHEPPEMSIVNPYGGRFQIGPNGWTGQMGETAMPQEATMRPSNWKGLALALGLLAGGVYLVTRYKGRGR